MAIHLYLGYVAACVIVVIVPGPVVTLVIANSLRHGTRAGLLNIAGTQLGCACMVAITLLLLLFGALFPQFIDPKGDYVEQVLLMGITVMAIAAIFDSTYALLSGRAAALLSERRVRLASWSSGLCLVGGGVWLAFVRGK
jgi:homoserine/homoserine lactone efflux protein